MKSKFTMVFGVLMIVSVILAACAPQAPSTVVVTEVVEGETVETVVTATPEPAPEEPVTLDAYSTTDIPTLDPQLATDVVSIAYIESLFVHLTNYDLETNEIVPEAATDWEISEDGLTYTFTVRTDIPWVYHNPVTGETTQVTDGEGNPQFVTAQDFAYGIRRACDPNLGSYYSTIIAPQIAGCEAALNAEDPDDEEALAALIEEVGVSAPSDDTLVINLAFPATYFLQMSTMWPLTAVPQSAIEEHEDQWIEAGNIVTSGRYVLNEWVHGVRRVLLRNPMMPEDMAGSGNVERIVTQVVPDTSTGYALWLNNEVDTSGIPSAELEAHLEQFPDETDQVPDLAVFYFGFINTKEPFDDARVRRAFSAAFDRETFVEEIRQGQGQPMKHFAPPGIFGAPPIDEVGVGFDPEYAAEQLADAGYPNCEGFPTVTLLGYSGESTLNWIEYAQGQWEEHLGCSPDQIQIEQQAFAELLTATSVDTPVEDAPHMYTLGWGPDYPDENNWVGDVLWCEGNTRTRRDCTETDDLIEEARTEQDPQARVELYREIEQRFFGPEGEMPFAPLFLRIAFTARHSWLERTPALFGGEQWYNWTIDWDAKQAAQGS